MLKVKGSNTPRTKFFDTGDIPTNHERAVQYYQDHPETVTMIDATGRYAVGSQSRINRDINAYMMAVSKVGDDWVWIMYCLTCGGEGEHEEDCPRTEPTITVMLSNED